MVFNDTKVVPARLFFKKETGALIEILCLNPDFPADYAQSFASKKSCIWSVVIGNAKKWKGGFVYFFSDSASNGLNFRAELVEKGEGKASKVLFLWDSDLTFSAIYAHYEGSVAAPTAGLHFTDRVLKSLDDRNIKRTTVCLHVGAGTFVPVKSEYISAHKMHSEPFSVSRAFLENLLEAVDQHRVVAVGTTSTRCLESLYYIGVQCIEHLDETLRPTMQWEPYERDYDYTVQESIGAIIAYMDKNGLSTLFAATSIIIVPGFRYRVVDMLVTNFHQPQSTLLLLISAFIGEDWRKIYSHALESGYRFLSYGDSSLLKRKERNFL